MTKKQDEEWRRKVCEKAGYICQVSGRDYSASYYFNEKGVNQYVCGHHIKGKKAHPQLRHDIGNGLCVDMESHAEIEKLHGIDIADAIEIAREKLNKKKNGQDKTSPPLKKKKTEKFWGATKPPQMPKKSTQKVSKKRNKISKWANITDKRFNP